MPQPRLASLFLVLGHATQAIGRPIRTRKCVNDWNRLRATVTPQMLWIVSEPCSIRLVKSSGLMSNVSVTLHDSPVFKAAYQSQ